MSRLNVQIVGIEQAIRNLQELPKGLQRKHMRIAMNAAGGVLKTAAVSRVPRQTGLLKRSLSVKVKANKRGEWFAAVGPKRGMKVGVRTTAKGTLRAMSAAKTKSLAAAGETVRYANPARYAHLAEKGTKAHIVRATNKRVLAGGGNIYGRQVTIRARGSRFLQIAATVAGPQASAKAVQKLLDGIEHERSRLARA